MAVTKAKVESKVQSTAIHCCSSATPLRTNWLCLFLITRRGEYCRRSWETSLPTQRKRLGTFGIDSVTLWPFLAPFLPENGYAALVDEKAVFDFLINMAVVSLVFGVELIYVDILQGTFQPSLAVVKAITCLAAAYLFYQASIQGAASWGFTIKTAFVLYRDSLRKELRMVPAKSFFDEYNRWEAAGRFFRDHDTSEADTLFEVSPINNQPPDYKDRLT